LTFVMRDSTCIEQSAISLLKQDSINDKKRENKKVLLRSEWDLNPLYFCASVQFFPITA
jgi:hypothetical protein